MNKAFHSVQEADKSQAAAKSLALAPALLAAVFGVFLIFAAGFANSDVLHNAAHDGRHSFAFPCH